MRREGRQHGMVRTLRVYEMLPLPRRKMINEFSSTPTAGLFTKVPTKPTNHSKYTGKCGRPRCRNCRSQPVCKCMDKVKGSHKIRSTSDGGPQGFKFHGFSASGVLDYLDRVDRDDGTDCDDEEVDDSSLEIEEVSVGFDVDNHAVDDDGMGFCEVVLIWEQVDDGDESWCLIDEICI